MASDATISVRDKKRGTMKPLGVVTSPSTETPETTQPYSTSSVTLDSEAILLSQYTKDAGSTGYAPSATTEGLESRDPPAVTHRVGKKYLKFRPYVDPITIRPYKPPDKKYYFKFNNSNVQLIRYTLEDNGFREAVGHNATEWSLMWSCGTMKSAIYQQMNRY